MLAAVAAVGPWTPRPGHLIPLLRLVTERLRPLRGGEGRYLHYTRYLAQDLTANRITPGVIATGRIMETAIPGSSESNRDRAELVALRRARSGRRLPYGRRVLATDLSDMLPEP
jgi:hypothetical protein